VGGRNGVSEREELRRLRRVVARLTEAQQEALDATDQGLESGEPDPEDETQLLDANERLKEALVDVRDILEGASDDVREMLGGNGGAA
jgi:hypothetical protein